MQQVLCFILSLMALNCLAQEGTRRSQPVFPEDIRVERNVAYLPADRTEKADLYFPLTRVPEQKLPAVVLIHGGGWNNGQRDAKREINIGSTLARHGYVAMSVDYQLSYGKYIVWPTNLWDCKIAVRWLRKNAGRLGVDPDRIGVLGGSAGGHLAAMVALTTPADGLDPASPDGELSCRVRCCVDLYGVADIATYHDVHMLGQSQAEAPELYRKASPMTYVRSNAPPFLILHGTADTTVNPRQSERLAEALKQAGAPVQFLLLTGAGHSFDLQPKERDLRPLVLDFLDAHLKGGN